MRRDLKSEFDKEIEAHVKAMVKEIKRIEKV